MKYFWKRLVGRRDGQYIKALESYIMLTQTKLDELTARILANSGKITGLESQVSASAEKAKADAATIQELNDKLTAVPAAAPDLDDTAIDAAVTEQEAAVAAIAPAT